ncbi:MAG: hypothetical protein HY791_05950 [Deltaproteobacteria bacterium]|nr:hypothetical protein [Deltaproteobacteria bacterium]
MKNPKTPPRWTETLPEDGTRSAAQLVRTARFDDLAISSEALAKIHLDLCRSAEERRARSLRSLSATGLALGVGFASVAAAHLIPGSRNEAADPAFVPPRLVRLVQVDPPRPPAFVSTFAPRFSPEETSTSSVTEDTEPRNPIELARESVAAGNPQAALDALDELEDSESSDEDDRIAVLRARALVALGLRSAALSLVRERCESELQDMGDLQLLKGALDEKVEACARRIDSIAATEPELVVLPEEDDKAPKKNAKSSKKDPREESPRELIELSDVDSATAAEERDF